MPAKIGEISGLDAEEDRVSNGNSSEKPELEPRNQTASQGRIRPAIRQKSYKLGSDEMNRILAFVAMIILADCTGATATFDENETLTIKATRSALLGGVVDLMEETEAAHGSICQRTKMTPKGNATMSDAESSSALRRVEANLTTVKGIVNLFPANTVEFAATCRS